VYPVQTDGAFPTVLGEYIRTHGARNKLFSDNAKAQQSAKVKEILRNFAIANASSEPHYQNQNAAEREIQDVKKDMEMVMNLTNTPYEWWPLCVKYIAMVKNHTARSSLKNRTPIEVRTGQTPDVSKLLQYRRWEPVYFLDKEGTECLGRWAGVAEHVGEELTFIVVLEKTGHAMFRLDLLTATDSNAPNFRAKTVAADHLVSSGAQDPGSAFSPIGQLPEVGEVEKVYPYAPEDLVGKTFMREEQGTGDFIRYEIVRLLKKESEATKEKLQYLVENRNGNQSTEEVMDYAELCDIVEAQIEAVDNGENGGLLTFKSILAHQGPLSVRNPQYKGSAWNILVELDVGDPTWEPLNLIAKCDPVSVAMYGEANGLLNKKGWKYLKTHAKNMRNVYRHVREIMKARLSDGPESKVQVRNSTTRQTQILCGVR
jgi:hypothetical protein